MKKNYFKLFTLLLFAGAFSTILQSLPSEGGRKGQPDPTPLSSGDEGNGGKTEGGKKQKTKKSKKKQRQGEEAKEAPPLSAKAQAKEDDDDDDNDLTKGAAAASSGDEEAAAAAKDGAAAASSDDDDSDDDDAAAVKKGATAASSDDDDSDDDDAKNGAAAADEPSEAGKKAKKKKGLDIKLVDCGKEVRTVALAQECAQALLGKGKEVYTFLRKHESQHFGTAHDCEELSKEEDPKNVSKKGDPKNVSKKRAPKNLSKKRNPNKTFFYLKDAHHAGLEASLAQSQIVRCEPSDKGNKEAFVCFLKKAPVGCAPKQSNNVTVARMVINPKGTLVTLFPDYAEQKALGL